MHLMKIRSLTLIGLAGTLAFGTVGLTDAAPRKTQTHQAAARHTTILPLSEGPVLEQGTPGSFWTPQAADLRRLERDLPPSIADYYRQYIGITEGGKRLIYINGFSASVAPLAPARRLGHGRGPRLLSRDL
jgi:hypothetical protein